MRFAIALGLLVAGGTVMLVGHNGMSIAVGSVVVLVSAMVFMFNEEENV